MKTTDLIPLILLELNEGDKYGFELTKSIETKTGGKIIIKQPSLYTILKKLEKSKFITSFWQDSDIGGKRHYYRLTENGKSQVSTLPSFDALVSHILTENGSLFETEVSSILDNFYNTKEEPVALSDDKTVNNGVMENNFLSSNENEQVNFNFENEDKIEDAYPSSTPPLTTSNENNVEAEGKEAQGFSIMDIIANEKATSADFEQATTQVESIVPSEEVFSENSIDRLTEVEINNNNSQILKSEASVKEETFATSPEVQKFTEKESSQLSDEYKDKLKSIYSEILTDEKPVASTNKGYETDKIKYVDYVNISTKENYKKAKQISKNLIYRSLATSGVLIVLLIISSIVSSFTGASGFYTTFMLLGICIAIFYPTLLAVNHEKIRLDYDNKKMEIDLKKQLIFCVAIELIILLICIIFNISIGNNTLACMMNISNFENFYAPLLLGLSVFADLYFTYLFFFRLNDLAVKKTKN